MKKASKLLLTAILILGLTACNQTIKDRGFVRNTAPSWTEIKLPRNYDIKELGNAYRQCMVDRDTYIRYYEAEQNANRLVRRKWYQFWK